MNLFTGSQFLLLISSLVAADEYYDDDDGEAEAQILDETCDPRTNCLLPNCTCFGEVPLVGDSRPQFVMITFDDAVTRLNIQTYRKIAEKRTNSDGCPLSMTFFTTHEYNDYQFVNELYTKGHEIAVHSIT